MIWYLGLLELKAYCNLLGVLSRGRRAATTQVP